ncbi:MAG: hypothetical protein AMXMBFR13_06750 [Phycisphaerae bacterium]
MKRAIQLVPTRNGCAIAESTPRYDVLLHGQKVGQLYFNMTGYVGTLPLPGGRKLHMPESGISVYRREVARLNREWAAHAAGEVPDGSSNT